MNVKTSRSLNTVMGWWRESGFESADTNALSGDDSRDVAGDFHVNPNVVK